MLSPSTAIASGNMMTFTTKQISEKPEVMAPDGAEVRVLCQTSRGSMAHFSLPPGGIAKAVAHRTIDEIWYVVSGHGQMWRKHGDQEEIVEMRPGLSLTIPLATQFQFRADGDEPLAAVGVAIPPWPSMDEAYVVEGPWQPTE
jgi:mannose-6-phosphate isomerase-like protein (cupin superfamily)